MIEFPDPSKEYFILEDPNTLIKEGDYIAYIPNTYLKEVKSADWYLVNHCKGLTILGSVGNDPKNLEKYIFIRPLKEIPYEEEERINEMLGYA